MTAVRIIVFCVYLVVSVLEIAAHVRSDGKQQKIFKPLCMPLLILLYLLCAGTQSSVLIILGLAFGFLGDTFLLKDDVGHFLMGASAFLIGHVFYIIAFLTHVNWAGLPQRGVWILPVAALYIIFLLLTARKLFPSLEKSLKPGIVAYMGTILVMSFSTFLFFLSQGTPASAVPFVGSLLFVLSDTVLAFSVFQKKPHWPVMPTYLAAQFLIMWGAYLVR